MIACQFVDLTSSPAPFWSGEMPQSPREGELIQLPDLRYKVHKVTWNLSGGEWFIKVAVTPDLQRI
jgi:hypothetical protein